MVQSPIRPDVAATRAAAGRQPSSAFADLLEAGATAQPGPPPDRAPPPDRRDGAAAASGAGARAATGADRQGRDTQAGASNPTETSADPAPQAGTGATQGQVPRGNQASRDTRNDASATDPADPVAPADAAAAESAAADAAAVAAAEDAAAAALAEHAADTTDTTDAASPDTPAEPDHDKPKTDSPAADPTLALLMTGQFTPVVATALVATLPDAAAVAAGTSTDASAALAIDAAQGQATPATQALIAAAAAASATSPPLTQAAPPATGTSAVADATLAAATAPSAEKADVATATAAATPGASPLATNGPESPRPQPAATAPSDTVQPKAPDTSGTTGPGIADARAAPSPPEAPRDPTPQPQSTERRPPAPDTQPDPAGPARNDASPSVDPKQAAILVQQSGALQTPATVPTQHPAGRPAAAEPGVPLAGVAVQIATRALNGERSFDIRLDPPELGRVDVKLHVDAAGKVTSHLVVDRPETLDLLKRDAPALERALNSAGLKTDDNGSLQFSLRDQSFFGRDHGNPDRQAPASRLIVPDDDLPVETAVRGYGRLLGVGSGVDIRV